MSRTISDVGVQLVAGFEGYKATAYQDVVGVWTIGYGHTGYVKFHDKNVCAGMTITKEQAFELLSEDLGKAEAAVNKYYSRYTWNQNEFDALVSFAFNVGSINQLTANGLRSRSIIAEKILLYNKAGEKTILGLTQRRKAERELFLAVVDPLSNLLSAAETSDKTDKIIYKVKITANTLNIRKGPDTSYAVIDSIKDKGVYTIIKTIGSWGYLKSQRGWICLRYTKKVVNSFKDSGNKYKYML